MDSIIGQTANCLVLIDDIFVFSDTHEEHHAHRHSVLSLLRVKYVFGASCVDFIGHCIRPESILPLIDKVSVIRGYPTTIK